VIWPDKETKNLLEARGEGAPGGRARRKLASSASDQDLYIRERFMEKRLRGSWRKKQSLDKKAREEPRLLVR